MLPQTLIAEFLTRISVSCLTRGGNVSWSRHWRSTLLLALAVTLGGATTSAVRAAAAPIRIGMLGAASNVPDLAQSFQRGWQLALDEINAAGGVLGQPLEVLARDDGSPDGGNPDRAVQIARDLIEKDKVALLAGTFNSRVALAVSERAARSRRVFIATGALTDALVWDKGNRYTFRLRPSTYMQAAMLVEHAVRLPGRRWFMVAPNYEYGQTAVATFKALLKARRPDVLFVGEHWQALGKLDALAAVAAIDKARPDAVFNAFAGPDVVRLIESGNARGVFPRVPVVSLLTGEPEQLAQLRGKAQPQGWIVTGYVPEDASLPEHARFVAAYRARYNELPRHAALLGYITVGASAAALHKAGSTDSEALVTALRGLRFDTPLGPVTIRAQDHQSTLGTYVGRLAPITESGVARSVLINARYIDGARVQPPAASLRTLRPAAAQK